MLTRHRALLLPFAVIAPALALFAWWSLDSGGYAPIDWLPGVLLVLALLLVARAVFGASFGPPSRAALVAVAALGAYTLWSFASVAWADARGPALEGAQRTLLYLGVFALFTCVPWTIRTARVAVLAMVLIVDVAGAVTLVHVGSTSDPLRLFVDARLSSPLSYQNADAALWSMGALPGIVLAARQETPIVLRPVLLAFSGLLLALGVMTQSRGWLYTLPVIAVLLVAIAPGRLRLLLFTAPVAAGVMLASGEIVRVYDVLGGLFYRQAAPFAGLVIDDAVDAIVRMTVGLLSAGTVMVLVDRFVIARIAISAGVRRAASRAALAATILALIVAGGWATTQDLSGRADRAWSDFQQVSNHNANGTARDERFSSVEGARYDYWRVALNLWRAHPIAGAGQDNFAEAYSAARRTTDDARWVHSLPLRLLVHTGVVGALLFAVFLLALAWAVARAWRPRRPAPERAVVVAACAALLVWLVHGSVDWLWEYPLLSGLALAGAGIAVAVACDGGPRPPLLARAQLDRRVAPIAVGAAALAAVAIVVPSYVADRDVRAARTDVRSSSAAAFHRLERARRLDRFGVQASFAEEAIALADGRPERARRALLVAIEREPHNWRAYFDLGLISAQSMGDFGAARSALETARRLNPREPVLALARQRLAAGRPMTVAEATARFARRANERLGR